MAEDEEHSASFQLPPVDSKRGQMMMIYLPEGAVIVDRGEVTGGTVQSQSGGQSPDATQSAGADSVSSGTLGQSREVEGIVLRRRHKIDWVHSLNIAFASFVALVSIAPWIITVVFGISYFGAKMDIPAMGVHRGDLIVSHILPVDRVVVGDVILLRNDNTWNLQLREVISIATTGKSTTITTSGSQSASASNVIHFNNASKVRHGTSVIPFFGYFYLFLTSIALEAFVVASVLILNVVVYFRRRRARWIDDKLAFIVK